MITIMTPTYNRAYILKNAYESLKNQTSFAFEWVIVDDGSTDETESVVKQWVEQENNFSIIYIKQKNGGKHRAVNKGVSLAKYDYFLILDSDDSLTDNAVATIHEWIADVAQLKGFAGVVGLKGNGSFAVGGKPQAKYIDATNLQRRKFGLLGDKAEVYKTEVLKQYPFPEFEGENFIRESSVWDRIAKDGLKLRFYNEIIYLCEYIEDGLTKNTNAETYSKNFNGFTYCSKLFLETHSLFLSLHKCGEFYDVAKRKKLTKREAARLLDVSIVFMQVGVFVFKMKQIVKRFYNKIKVGIRRG